MELLSGRECFLSASSVVPNQPPSSPRPNTPGPRVVSLSPGATDSLCGLGGAGLLVGRSSSCDHPDALAVEAITDRHGHVFADRLAALRADVVLAGTQGAEGCTAQVVVVSPLTVEGVFDSVLAVGRAVGRDADAARSVVRLRERFFSAGEFVNPYDDGPVTVFLESVEPMVCSGRWIAQLVERAGARHPLNPTVARAGVGSGSGPQFAERTAGQAVRVPEDVFVAINPERVVLCPREGGLEAGRAMERVLQQKAWYSTLRAVQQSHIAVVDGTRTFHRAGPGIVDAYEWLVGWVNGLPARNGE